jgi:hypothetical protein
MLTKTQTKQIADSISDQQLNALKLHLEYALKSKESIHPRTLFADTKALLDVDDFAQFHQLISACMECAKLPGYTNGPKGVIVKEQAQKSYLSVQPKQDNKDSHRIIISGKKYSYLVKDSEIRSLLLIVLGAKEDNSGMIEFCDKKYSCSEIELLKKLLVKFFGAI